MMYPICLPTIATVAWNDLLYFLHLSCLPIHGGLPAGADQYSDHGMSANSGGGNESRFGNYKIKLLKNRDISMDRRNTIHDRHSLSHRLCLYGLSGGNSKIATNKTCKYRLTLSWNMSFHLPILIQNIEVD